jgi:2'-5' RNA ligase
LRAFVALDLQATFLDHVAALAERLRGDARLRDARWVTREQMHLTLRFLGNIENTAADAFGAMIAQSADARAIELEAAGLLVFPDPRRARVLTIAIREHTGRLVNLAARCDALAIQLGLEPSEVPYQPHLTLARFARPRDLRALVAEVGFSHAGAATALTLYRSDTRREGPVYTSVSSLPLSK